MRRPPVSIAGWMGGVAAAGLGAAAGRILGRTGASLGSGQPAQS